MDVRATVEQLESGGVKVHCLALGGVDLTSAAGKMTIADLSAAAEFERDLLIERTQAGLERAKREGKREGKKLGRPAITSKDRIQELIANGLSQPKVATALNISLGTIKRYWE